MARIRRIGKIRTVTKVSSAVLAWFSEGIKPDSKQGPDAFWELFQLEGDLLRSRTAESDLLRTWRNVRDELVAEWITKHPGTRPWMWWELEAPRQPRGTFPGHYYEGQFAEPRLRLGGVGVYAWEHFAYVPQYQFGLPALFESFDQEDPPVFESSAAYLRRHELLNAAEKRKLTARDFAPVALELGIDACLIGPFTPDATKRH